MKRLMIHVERAVRPVRGEVSTKCRMREELYAHISEIYEEELERGGNKDTAIRRACERFGDPARLTAELQAAVPWAERIAYPFDDAARRRLGETPLRHAVRVAATLFCFTMIALTVSLPVCPLLVTMGVVAGTRQTPIDFALRFQTSAALTVWISVAAGLFAPIGPAMRDQLEAGVVRPRSWWTAGVLSLLAAATVLACGAGYLLTMPIDAATVIEQLPRWGLAALATPLMFAALSRLAAIDAVRSRLWSSLVIED